MCRRPDRPVSSNKKRFCSRATRSHPVGRPVKGVPECSLVAIGYLGVVCGWRHREPSVGVPIGAAGATVVECKQMSRVSGCTGVAIVCVWLVLSSSYSRPTGCTFRVHSWVYLLFNAMPSTNRSFVWLLGRCLCFWTGQ